jgi:hypothetical protein
MTTKEQTNLLSIARMRERVTKSQLEEVGAQILVDLDKQLDAYYSFNSDEILKEAHRIADEACKEAQAKVEERNRELGIPERFAPSLHLQLVQCWRAGFGGTAEKTPADGETAS